MTKHLHSELRSSKSCKSMVSLVLRHIKYTDARDLSCNGSCILYGLVTGLKKTTRARVLSFQKRMSKLHLTVSVDFLIRSSRHGCPRLVLALQSHLWHLFIHAPAGFPSIVLAKNVEILGRLFSLFRLYYLWPEGGRQCGSTSGLLERVR